MGKYFRFIGFGLLSIAALLIGGVAWFLRRPWPQTSGTLTVPGLLAPVEVIRDHWGVPHIYAQNEHDLFMAQGYVHAQDRLWQMEFHRWTASGTLSAILGKATLDVDRFLRTIGLRRAAEKDYARLDDDMRAILTAYADGVNAYIETHRSCLPLEFTILRVKPAAWTALDMLAWGKVIGFNLGANREFELLYARCVAKVGEDMTRQLLPPYPDDAPVIIPPEVCGYASLRKTSQGEYDAVAQVLGEPTPDWGSNSWVVHGNRTVTGMPMLANDTHLGLGMPCVWYANGLHGGRFDSVGFSFPGVPMVVIGHNRCIAWGASNLGPDVQDFYLEKLNDPTRPTQYEFGGEWHDLEILQETIEVKGQAPVELDVLVTHHGPLMNSVIPSLENATPMALRWTGLAGSLLFKSIVLINLATNWDEFRQALRYWDVPGQNFVYADVEGDIGYQTAGKIPIRVPSHQGVMPMPGWSGDYEWQGFIPFEELPNVLNPSTGFVVTANNKVVPDDYPYHLAYEWAPPYRAQRIIDLLAANEAITIKDMQAIQAQTYAPPAAVLRPYLLEVEPKNSLQADALNHVRVWDLYYETDRIGASIYQVWYWFLVQHTFIDQLGTELMNDFLGYPFLHIPLMIKWLPQMKTRDEIVHRSFVDALNWLSERFGANPRRWQWGRLHTMTFVHQPLGQSGISLLEHLFNSRAIPARGDHCTVNTGSFNFKKPFAMNMGPAQRLIMDLSNPGHTLAVHTTGQSEHLFHPHREDFITMWQNVEYHPLFFNREEIEDHAEAMLTLTPC